VPLLDLSRTARYPVLGAMVQRRGGTARHDAVAWGYARAADARGVDIIQNCAVTGSPRRRPRHRVETTRGPIRAAKIGVAAAGHAGVVMAMAGLRLPIESFPIQAFVSEPLKPVLDTVLMFGQVHISVSQSDKGELVFGGSRENYNSYAQRGNIRSSRPDRNGARAAADRQPAAADAAMGGDRRLHAGCEPDHRPHRARRALPQLRLGHRRLQGDAGLGLGLRRHHRAGRPHPSPPASRSTASAPAASSTRAPPRPRSRHSAGMTARVIIQSVAWYGVFGLLLFLPAGTLAWPGAWPSSSRWRRSAW